MAFFRKKKEIPIGLWMKCPSCGKMAFTKTVEDNLHVCPDCDHHMKVNAPTRLKQLLDAGHQETLGEDLEPRDLLRFKEEGTSYEEKLRKNRQKAGVTEAVMVARGTIEGIPVTVAAMDFSFRGGSMGVVVGERIARAAEDALERRVPLVIVATSGGARMQEGALSLMQMAKTSAVIARLREAAIPYIAVLADPCTGGVSASFAAQGDVTLAEPGALIGFAGPRVIQNTIRAQLPDGFQRAEFLLEKGYLDRIVHRRDLKRELAAVLRYLVKAPAPQGASR
jgi:acetyl-CoA carboxylase carboxyl transferase subunit beta